MSEDIMVDMGEYRVAHNPSLLVSLGLGSCVGVAFLDPDAKIGGLAHVMLPQMHDNSKEQNENKYADHAITNMLNDMIKQGCKKERIKAKIVGGAHMFATLVQDETMDIGKLNAEKIKSILKDYGIPVIADETGGSVGRTVRFDTSTGKISIKTKDGIKEI